MSQVCPGGRKFYFFYHPRKVRYLNAQEELGAQKKICGALGALLLCFIFWSYYNHLLYRITDYKMTTLYWEVLGLSEIGFTQSQSCLDRVGGSGKTGGTLRNVISVTHVVFYHHNTQFVSQNKLKQTGSGWPSGLGADLRPPSLTRYKLSTRT